MYDFSGQKQNLSGDCQGERTKFSSIYNCLKNDDHPGCPAGTFHAFALLKNNLSCQQKKQQQA
jgi:hypothetical protein